MLPSLNPDRTPTRNSRVGNKFGNKTCQTPAKTVLHDIGKG